MAYGPRGTAAYENRPTPLFYGAGFLPKIPVFETMVGMDASGGPVTGLAERWEVSADRRVYDFHLRPGARFHDGRPCDAAAVAAHFERLGSEEDRFIGMYRCLDSVSAIAPTTVRFELSRPYPLLLDLCIINPNAVVVPEAPRDAEPAVLIGTGPFRFEGFAPMERAVYRRFEEYDGERPRIESFSLKLFAGGGNRSDVLPWALERGHVDGIVEGWRPTIPREKAADLAGQTGFELLERPGSAVALLVLNTQRAPFDRIGHRRFLAGLVDREALVEYAEHGFADPTSSVFAPGVSDWPKEQAAPAAGDLGLVPAALAAAEPVLLVQEDPASLACGIELARQCWERGVRLRVERIARGPSGSERINRRDYDLLLTETWGMPYDPHATLLARFLPPPDSPTAVETVPYYTDPGVTAWIESSFTAPFGSTARREAYAAIQGRLTEQVPVLPLYIARRIAVVSTRVRGLELGPHGYGLDLSEVELVPDGDG